jgi:chromosome segregation protein
VILERSGKYVKGTYTLSGGSVGLFEGKKIGRAKNLEKLQEEIVAQKAIVDDYTAQIQTRHNEVIAYNQNLKEQAIRDTEREIQQLNNQSFGIQNRLENLHH